MGGTLWKLRSNLDSPEEDMCGAECTQRGTPRRWARHKRGTLRWVRRQPGRGPEAPLVPLNLSLMCLPSSLPPPADNIELHAQIPAPVPHRESQ